MSTRESSSPSLLGIYRNIAGCYLNSRSINIGLAWRSWRRQLIMPVRPYPHLSILASTGGFIGL